MRYTLINGLLLLSSPLTSLALPLEPNPNDQGGVWDPSGQYRKGHYDGAGNFIPNNGYNGNGDYNDQYSNDQYNNGQYRGDDWNNGQRNNGQYNNGRWQRRSLTRPFGDRLRVGVPGINIPGIHARNWPYDQNNNGQNGQGWTDANGQWHSTDYSQGWTDANGQWHPNNNNGQNGQGWTDANGQWHSNNNGQNGQGWTDANGQWHPTAKRGIPPTPAGINVPGAGAPNPGTANLAAAQPGAANLGAGASPNLASGANKGANPLSNPAAAASALHARHYRDDDYNGESDRQRELDREDYDRNREQDRQDAHDALQDVGIIPRFWPFTSGNRNNDHWNNDNNDWNNHYNDNDWNNDDYGYNDKCKNNDYDDRSGFDCRHDWDVNRATPSARAVARNYPSTNTWNHGPQVSGTPLPGDNGNYQNYGSYQDYPKKNMQNKDNKMKESATKTKE